MNYVLGSTSILSVDHQTEEMLQDNSYLKFQRSWLNTNFTFVLHDIPGLEVSVN